MSFRVIDILAEYTDRSTGTRAIMAEIEADTAADLPAPSADLVYILGSYAHTVDTGGLYKVNSSGAWILQPSGNVWQNVYTKSEIDSFLSAIDQTDSAQNLLLADLIDSGRKNMFKVCTRIGTNNSNASAVYTQSGVRYTANGDGTITVERISSSSADSLVWLYDDNAAILIDDYCNGLYTFSNGFSGSASTARLRLAKLDGGQHLTVNDHVIVPDRGSETGINTSIIVYSTFSGSITVKPMCCLTAAYNLSTNFVPFVPSLWDIWTAANT